MAKLEQQLNFRIFSVMSSWELKKPGEGANRLDTLRSTKMYEHIRDSLLLHFHSVLVMFTFIPELGEFVKSTNFVLYRDIDKNTNLFHFR